MWRYPNGLRIWISESQDRGATGKKPGHLRQRAMLGKVLLLVALCFSLPSILQSSGTAILSGTVEDPSGARVQDAAIQIRSASGTVLSATSSNADGEFRMDSLPQGGLILIASKPGFLEFRKLLPPLNDQRTVSIMLELGGRAEELTVSAESGTIETTVSTPQQVNVIRPGELRRRAYWNLSAAAADEPGLGVQATSPTIGGIYVRGMSGDDVPVFLDGVRVTTSAARGGINTFFNLNEATNLEAMEVLRGPNSAQYGSDSLGGVIALQSRTPHGASGSTSLRLSGGSAYESADHSFGSDLSASFSRGNLGIVWNFAGRRVNTLRTGSGLDSHSALTRFLGLPSNVLYHRLPDTAFTQYGGMVHGQWNTSYATQTVFHYQRSQQDGGKRFDQLLGGDGNLIADLDNLIGELGYLRYVAFPDRWINYVSVTGSFLTQREVRRNQGGQGNPASAIRTEFERASVWGAGLQLGSNRSRRAQIMFGGDSYLENIRARATSLDPATEQSERIRARIPDKARYVHSGGFAQATWSPNSSRLRVSGAVRVHRAAYRVRAEDAPLVQGVPLFSPDSLTVSNVSGRIGAVVGLGGGWWLRGYYARGFRAPTVTNLGTLGLTGNGFEVGYSELGSLAGEVGTSAGEDAQSTGQPVDSLRPELSDNYDLGVSWETRRIRWDATAFLIRRTNVITKRALILPAGAQGSFLGDQPIVRQDSSGIVFVPLVPNPVLVRANADAADFHGIEQRFEWRISPMLSLFHQLAYVYAKDSVTGLPPDINSGVPAPNGSISLRVHPASRRFWVEAAVEGALRQSRISSVGLTDRRVGAARSRSSIARYFRNGAVAQGLVLAGNDSQWGTADDILAPTGETLAEVQNRVLGAASSAPLFGAVPGYALIHLRAGFRLGESQSVWVGLENVTDRNYRGLAWGLDGKGRNLAMQWRFEF